LEPTMPTGQYDDMRCALFEDRRKVNPQGVIDDLISQTTRQAVAIHSLTAEVERLRESLEKENSQKELL
jgi:hypothetical protein